MPSVESTIRTEYSNRCWCSRLGVIERHEMAAAEPRSARIFRNRAKPSTTKAAVEGRQLALRQRSTIAPAITRSAIAAKSTSRRALAAIGAEHQERHGADAEHDLRQQRNKRGKLAAFIVPPRQRRRLHGAERVLVIVDQLRHRRRRNIEHRLRINAEHDGQDHERRQHDHFAPADVLDVNRLGFSSLPKITLR
jgi:hypothetical protein